MKVDTAERLAERAMRISDDLNEMVRDIEANEPGEESARLRHAIGRVMWALYYEVLRPAFEEHPSIESDSAATHIPALMAGPSRRAARAVGRVAPPAPPDAPRPRRRRGSRR